jgi:signal transduction histidine kinase
MRWLIPQTLAGRTIAVLLVGLGLFHLWSIWIYQVGIESLLGSTRDQQLAERLVSIKRAIAALPSADREQTAHALSTATMEIHWSPLSLLNPMPMVSERITLLRKRLRELVPEITDDQVRLAFADEGPSGSQDSDAYRHLLLASLQLPDGSWVNFRLATFQTAPTEHGILASLSAMALGILLVSFVLVRSLTAPLRMLARAADRVGIDFAAPEVSQTGPREIQQVAKAFNRMQMRIKRLVDDRTQTLAAVSHDLKTPITRLRLRAEFVKDEELRQTIESDLVEMERMIESTLAFLRGDATSEESKVVDVGTILETICDSLADAGHDVVLSGNRHGNLRCKPLAIKRALSNVIDNAIKYGTRARVALQDKTQELVVTVDDEGPGISDEEHGKVFDPFYRVEGSRSRETGGTGLGLTVARTVIRSHGGDIVLENRGGRGLRVTVSLPKAPSLER